MNTILVIYVWVVICTCTMLILEVNIARRFAALSGNKAPPRWGAVNIMYVLAISTCPPAAWFVTYLVYRQRAGNKYREK